MKTRLYSLLKFVVGWPLSLLAFFFVGKIIIDQAPAIQSNIHSLNPFVLAYGISCFFLYYFFRSLIWQRILKHFGYTIRLKESNYLWSMSELKRYIPGKVWAYLGRAVVFNRKEISKKDIAKGMVIELELFTIGCAIVSLLALPYLLPGYTWTIGWITVFFLSIAIMLYIYASHISSKYAKHFIVRLRTLFPPFHAEETLILIALSAAGLFFYGLGNYFVISSFYLLEPQLVFQLIGVFVFTFLAGFLSFITPAGFGVREGILTFALSKIINSGVAAVAALFSRVFLIFSELLYVGISYVWYKMKISWFVRIEKWVASHPYETIVFVMIIVYILYFVPVTMLRYDNFFAGRFDLGNMAQTVWNTSIGNIFMFTNPDSTQEVSRLAFHADFILILLAPFYWIWPDPRVLLIIQTVVIAAGAYFVYLIAKKVLNHQLLGLVLAFAYLINPSVQRVNLYDFHAVAFATTFFLGTFYFYLQKKYIWFLVFALLAAICKEQLWAIIAIFGLFLMIHHKQWIFGSVLFLISVGMFYFLVSYAIPGSHGSSEHFALNYFSEFGDSPAQVIKTVALSPDRVVGMLFEEERSKYLRQLFSPLGYLSFLAPWMLIFAGPDLMINILSSNDQLHYIYYQYTAAITPFIFIAAIYGIWVLSKLPVSLNKIPVGNKHWRSYLLYIGKHWKLLIVFYLFYTATNTAYLYGPLPGALEPNTAMFLKPESNREFIDETIASIPPEASVSASNNIASHFSNRRYIYVLPQGVDHADYVVFLISHTHTSWSLTDEKALLEKLKSNPQYSIVAQKDGFTVLKNNK